MHGSSRWIKIRLDTIRTRACCEDGDAAQGNSHLEHRGWVDRIWDRVLSYTLDTNRTPLCATCIHSSYHPAIIPRLHRLPPRLRPECFSAPGTFTRSMGDETTRPGTPLAHVHFPVRKTMLGEKKKNHSVRGNDGV